MNIVIFFHIALKPLPFSHLENTSIYRLQSMRSQRVRHV